MNEDLLLTFFINTSVTVNDSPLEKFVVILLRTTRATIRCRVTLAVKEFSATFVKVEVEPTIGKWFDT